MLKMAATSECLLAWLGIGTPQRLTHHPLFCRYCENICVRTVRYEVDAANSENMKLRVCHRAFPTQCIEIDGSLRWRDAATQSEEWDGRNRRFSAHLPQYKFDVKFVDENGNEAWPTFVSIDYQDTQVCPTSFENNEVRLLSEGVSERDCRMLIKNGDAEMSPDKAARWLYTWGGVELAPGEGLVGAAIASTSYGGRSAFTQFLDTRCLELLQGRYYELTAFVKLLKKDGSTFICDPDNEPCPEAGVTWNGLNYIPSAWVVSQASIDNGYQLVHGLVKINSEMIEQGGTKLFVSRNPSNHRMLVDNVSLNLMDEHLPIRSACDNLVFNGDFQDGTSRFWVHNNAKSQSLVSSGSDYALKMTGGRNDALLRMGCLQEGRQYEITGYYKLQLPNGRPTQCTSNFHGNQRCPRLLVAYYHGSDRQFTEPAMTVGEPSSVNWNELKGVFTATADMIEADELRLMIAFLNDFDVIVLDNLSIRRL